MKCGTLSNIGWPILLLLVYGRTIVTIGILLYCLECFDIHEIYGSLGSTCQRGIDTGVQLEFYVDADCAYKATDWRSISGGVVMCAGACVSFSLGYRHALRFLLRKRFVVCMPVGSI